MKAVRSIIWRTHTGKGSTLMFFRKFWPRVSIILPASRFRRARLPNKDGFRVTTFWTAMPWELRTRCLVVWHLTNKYHDEIRSKYSVIRSTTTTSLKKHGVQSRSGVDAYPSSLSLFQPVRHSNFFTNTQGRMGTFVPNSAIKSICLARQGSKTEHSVLQFSNPGRLLRRKLQLRHLTCLPSWFHLHCKPLWPHIFPLR